MTEWRCKRDGVLLARVRDGQLEIRYKEIAYTIEGVRRIKAVCRKCGTENVLDLNNNRKSA